MGNINEESHPELPYELTTGDTDELNHLEKQHILDKPNHDPEYEKVTDTMWHKLSPEEEKKIENDATKAREAKGKYAALRSHIVSNLESSGITDYELYGAGARGEELSVLEYSGALRVIGPNDPTLAEKFIRIVQSLAAEAGYKIDMDRPPSVSHAFGQTIKRGEGGESSIIKGRPILYIYKRYQTGWPSPEDMQSAYNAGANRGDTERLRNAPRFYENRISQLASEITDDPHDFAPKLPSRVAKQIYNTPEFHVVREEMKDASQRSMGLRRSIHMPVDIGDMKFMVYLLAESMNGSVYIDLLGCPDDIKNGIIPILSRYMLA